MHCIVGKLDLQPAAVTGVFCCVVSCLTARRPPVKVPHNDTLTWLFSPKSNSSGSGKVVPTSAALSAEGVDGVPQLVVVDNEQGNHRRLLAEAVPPATSGRSCLTSNYTWCSTDILSMDRYVYSTCMVPRCRGTTVHNTRVSQSLKIPTCTGHPANYDAS